MSHKAPTLSYQHFPSGATALKRCKPFRQICQGGSRELYNDQAKHVLKSEIFWRRQVLDLLIFIDTWYEELGRSWSVLSASAFGLGARSCLNVFNWKYPWQNPWTKLSISSRQEACFFISFKSRSLPQLM